MARAPLTSTPNDVNTDAGGVLWSLIQGEQLEFPITINFVNDASVGYEYEAVVLEGLNTSAGTKPVLPKSLGEWIKLDVRTRTNRGVWQPTTAYDTDQIVSYNGLYYSLSGGISRTSSTPPSGDSLWVTTTPNIVYVRFPRTLGGMWATQPTAVTNTYGFFELRVTETGVNYPRTWKPVRGMVEILFSPTELVP